MNFVVCLKQVPDTSEVRIDPVTNTLMREGVPSIINPYDAHGLEEAIRLKEKMGGKVTIVSMGPPQAKEALKKAMTYGADRAILLSDRAFGGSDSLATAYILSMALQKIHETEPIDLVFAGKEAIDGDTAQTGPGIAQRLGFPQLTYAIKVRELTDTTVTVERKTESGRQIVQAQLPALLTVEKELNDLRYASLPNMMKAAAYEPEVWDAKTLPFDVKQMGLKGSPTSVSRIFAPPGRSGGEIFDATKDPASIAATVVQKLFQSNIIMVNPLAKGGKR
ncbi:electron transfer flavoprotein subunit beta/FixA family protein [Desulfosporosinus sp.]|uniref:electron transfer flavoprotein subunit beta/FixA family protein n=1 Tax=Desulfosporosinus sp. TaxID=157907 RepID=UPI000E9376B1|nr:electron transfer flavoprotein subunit beta/FixA family protein [Desulfosporosinus sp.]MBC2722906.1 electron transfer flavoprotein subunit beta/FixA family protein [Desulfosporosinus sp.]MBC2725374.1 electron transfer flavoprotein subunit beta/FixA family protein [Desulfosporosinus sp.]HBV85706.1 electron transfer flavoprotein subunit beta [Desulfosporosinus sp.]